MQSNPFKMRLASSSVSWKTISFIQNSTTNLTMALFAFFYLIIVNGVCRNVFVILTTFLKTSLKRTPSPQLRYCGILQKRGCAIIQDPFNIHNQTRLFALVWDENKLQMGFYSLKIGQNMPRLPAACTIRLSNF